MCARVQCHSQPANKRFLALMHQIGHINRCRLVQCVWSVCSPLSCCLVVSIHKWFDAYDKHDHNLVWFCVALIGFARRLPCWSWGMLGIKLSSLAGSTRCGVLGHIGKLDGNARLGRSPPWLAAVLALLLRRFTALDQRDEPRYFGARQGNVHGALDDRHCSCWLVLTCW